MNAKTKGLMERARKRILAIADKDYMVTPDPLGAEIALAQVDATLAVAAALSSVDQRVARLINKQENTMDFLRDIIERLQTKLERAEALAASLNRPDEPEGDAAP